MRKTVIAAALTMLAAGPAAADVTGMAVVEGGDVISINGQMFRLFGVDAVEFHQFCYVDGKPWNCGAAAIRSLQTLASVQPVTCKETGESAGALGQWARCEIGGLDISSDIVRNGMGVALRDQTTDYVDAEEKAKAEGKGIWASVFAEPAAYRRDMKAVEDVMDARLLVRVRSDVDAGLTEGASEVEIFHGFEVKRGPEPGTEREIPIDRIKGGVLFGTIAGDVFNWRDSGRYTTQWRADARLSVQRAAAGFVWTSLTERPRNIIETPDAATYLTAIRDAAAPLLAAGRQPILAVRNYADPPWIGEWFGEAPPAGMQISRKDTISADNYLGTVDGIDVYRMDLPEQESLVFADDMLVSVTYATDPAGEIVKLTEAPAAGEDPARILFRFAQSFVWKDDLVTMTLYPYKPPKDSYIGGG